MTTKSHKPKYIILRGIFLKNRFWTLNNLKDPTRLHTGQVAYEIIGYAETIAECQMKLYGRVTTTSKE